jgi:hypothetical protein
MDSNRKKVDPATRRGFLLGAGAASAAGAAAVVAARAPGATAGPAVAAAALEEPKGRGYRLTAHVRKYYETTTV